MTETNQTQTKDAAVITVRVTQVPDEDHDASYLEEKGFEDRLAEYRVGEFSYIGIIATAYLCGIKLAVESLWGIDDDSDPRYFEEIKAQLRIEALDEAKRKLAELLAAAQEIS